ncbi:MAG: SSS family transporter [Verrucomicrobiales bacterium]|jgi:SSS family transporter
MIWLRDHSFMLVLLVGYTALMVYHAWSGGRKTKGAADYFVGGRSMSGIALGISFFATYASTNTYLGLSMKAYDYGLAWMLLIPFAIGFSALSWILIAPRMRKVTESLDSVTIPDFIGHRFGSTPARALASVIVIFASFLYMTAVYKGIGNLLQAMLDVPYPVAILLVLVIVSVYTSVGGFHSVVKTDVVQGLLMIVAAFFIFWGITRAAGGIGSLSRLGDSPETASLLDWDTAMPLSIVIGIIFATTIKFFVDPRQLSRFYALKDRREMIKGVAFSTACFVVVFCLLVPLGLYARLALSSPVEDTDKIIPTLLADGSVFPSWVTAFLCVAIISAAMSSLDSVLLVMACTCQRDLVGLFRPGATDKSQLKTARILVFVFAIITALIALKPPGGIVAMTSFSGSLYAACFLPAIIFGLYAKRGSGAAVITSFAVGLAVLASWDVITGLAAPLANVHRVFPASVLSMIAFWLVSRFQPARV